MMRYSNKNTTQLWMTSETRMAALNRGPRTVVEMPRHTEPMGLLQRNRGAQLANHNRNIEQGSSRITIFGTHVHRLYRSPHISSPLPGKAPDPARRVTRGTRHSMLIAQLSLQLAPQALGLICPRIRPPGLGMVFGSVLVAMVRKGPGAMWVSIRPS